MTNRSSGGSVRASFSQTYDAVGNLFEKIDSNGSIATYSMDPKNRIIQVQATGTDSHTYNYSYDPTDNRLTSTETGSVNTWSYDIARRLTTAVSVDGPWTFTYSENGNLIVVQEAGDDPVTMTYDMENRLAMHRHMNNSQEPPVESVVSYTYDGDGRVRSESLDGVITTTVWDHGEYLQFRT